MKKSIYIFALLLIVSLACKDANEKDEVINLTGENIVSEIPFMRFPYRIDLVDSKIITLDLASDSMFYHILEYPSFQYSASVGKRGNGPDEIILPTPFQIFNNKLFTLDGAKGEISQYNIADKTIIDKNAYNIKLGIDFAVLNDTTVIFVDMTGKHRLIIASPNSKKYLFEIPDDNKNEDAGKTARLWRSFIAYNPALNSVALASQNGEVIEIYGLNDNSKKIVVGNDGKPQKENQIEGFDQIRWIDNDIYVLYSGRVRKEMNKAKDAGENIPSGCNKIRKYNKDGKLLKTYILDKYIDGFAYDKANNKFIGITSNNDNPIYIFPIGNTKNTSLN